MLNLAPIRQRLAHAAMLPGCGDNSCAWSPPSGMATNGGCRCADHRQGPRIIRWAGRTRRDVADLLGEVERLRAELTAIHTAIGDGADESAWPPGSTMAEAVVGLRGERAAVAAYLRAQATLHRQWGRGLTEYSHGHKAAALDAAADIIERGEHRPTGHEARPSPRCGEVMSERLARSGITIRTICILPAGHEGPHAEALADDGVPRG